MIANNTMNKVPCKKKPRLLPVFNFPSSTFNLNNAFFYAYLNAPFTTVTFGIINACQTLIHRYRPGMAFFGAFHASNAALGALVLQHSALFGILA